MGEFWRSHHRDSLYGLYLRVRWRMANTLLFKAGGVLSFAQSAQMTLGAFLVGSLGTSNDKGRIVSCLIAVAVAGAISLVVYYVFIARMKTTALFSKAVLTLGIAQILNAWIVLKYGASLFSVTLLPTTWGAVRVPGLGYTSPITLLAVGVTLVVFLLLWIFFQKTRVGLQLRAATDAPSLASRSRLNVRGLYALSWLMAGVLAAIAGIIIGAYSSVSTGISDVGLARVPGRGRRRIRQHSGALLGGLIIGFAQQFCTFYISPRLRECGGVHRASRRVSCGVLPAFLVVRWRSAHEFAAEKVAPGARRSWLVSCSPSFSPWRGRRN